MITVEQGVRFCEDVNKRLFTKLEAGDLSIKVTYDDVDGMTFITFDDRFQNRTDTAVLVSATYSGLFLTLMYQWPQNVGTDKFCFTDIPMKVVS